MQKMIAENTYLKMLSFMQCSPGHKKATLEKIGIIVLNLHTFLAPNARKIFSSGNSLVAKSNEVCFSDCSCSRFTQVHLLNSSNLFNGCFSYFQGLFT